MPKGIKGFQKGHPIYEGTERTRIKKGQHLSPSTEFIKGEHSSKSTEFKKGECSDENHINWKGDKVGYYALHRWIQKKL